MPDDILYIIGMISCFAGVVLTAALYGLAALLRGVDDG